MGGRQPNVFNCMKGNDAHQAGLRFWTEGHSLTGRMALCGLWMALKASYTKAFSVSLDPSYSLRIGFAEVFDAPQTAGAKWLVNVKVKRDSLEFKPANVVPLLWKQQGFHVSHGQSKTSYFYVGKHSFLVGSQRFWLHAVPYAPLQDTMH